jgi:hypothetical protein
MRNRLSPRDPEALTRVLAYQRRDARVKCSSCRRWMRYTATSKTPLARRGQPNASRCVECPPKVVLRRGA